jgi:sarcosine oxidase subunit gamma
VQREPACLECCCPGQFGAPAPHAGIAFSAYTNLVLFDLRGDPRDRTLVSSVSHALGIALPLEPNTSAAGDGLDVLWLGPDEWLLVGRNAGVFKHFKAVGNGFIADVSHGRAAWRISGPRTLDLLAKGCSLDLHPRLFTAGKCAQTAFAHVGVLLHKRAENCWDIYCARSYAQHLWHSLAEGAAEFGYEVKAPVGG